jgi:hypothetical protein
VPKTNICAKNFFHFPNNNKEQAMETGKIKTLCAWHTKYFGQELVMIEGPLSPLGYPSHGMCKECAIIFNKEADEFLEKEKGNKNEI